MNLLNINVRGNLIETDDSPMITGGSVNYDTCAFHFDSEWNGFSKTAVFAVGDSICYAVELDETAICKIPGECLRNAGILKIGVVGQNDENVIISTNIVTQRIVEGANSEEYENRETVDENGTIKPQYPADINLLHYSERYVVSDDFVEADYSSAEALDIHSYYDVDFDKLARDYPDYVRSRVCGTDYQNNEVLSYTFAGENYDRVILITANHLGSGKMILKALGGFFRELCSNHQSDAILNFLRNKVKFVVIPIVSPYAVFTSGRYNANGVKPFLNYDYLWDESPAAGKGVYAFSEKEILSVKDTLEELTGENLIYHLDLESERLDGFQKVFYCRADSDNEVNSLIAFTEFFDSCITEESGLSAVTQTNAPVATNYSSDTFGVNGCTLMLDDTDDTASVKRHVELIGNLMFFAVKTSCINKAHPPKPILRHIAWNSSDNDDYYQVTPGLKPMWISSFSQELDGAYNVLFDGYVIAEATDDTPLTVRPVLYQQNSAEDFEEKRNENIFDVTVNLKMGTHIVPFSCVMKTTGSYASSVFPGKLGAVISVGGLSVKIKGFSYDISCIPSDGKSSVEVLTPLGNASDYTSADDTPVFNLKYPKAYYDTI